MLPHINFFCRHPAIPTLHDFFFDIDGSIELVTDLMEGEWPKL